MNYTVTINCGGKSGTISVKAKLATNGHGDVDGNTFASDATSSSMIYDITPPTFTFELVSSAPYGYTIDWTLTFNEDVFDGNLNSHLLVQCDPPSDKARITTYGDVGKQWFVTVSLETERTGEVYDVWLRYDHVGSSVRDVAGNYIAMPSLDSESVSIDQTSCTDRSNGVVCDDGDACTTDDKCSSGYACVGMTKKCNSATFCQQNGVCNPESGACEYSGNHEGEECDDEDECVVDSVCRDGLCVGQPKECAEIDRCHVSYCQEGSCQNEPVTNCFITETWKSDSFSSR